MHTLLVGAQGAGKSSLINRLLEETKRPVFGFVTVKENALAVDERGAPIYIYQAGEERERSAENLVGYCNSGRPLSLPEGFDRFAPRLDAPCPPDSLILMDEIGFMESQSTPFCKAILEKLDGDVPVLAAVKDMDVPFLKTVRAHPHCRCFMLTKENRDELYPEISEFFRQQTQSARP